MRVVPINEAEAIIEPLWDGGNSDHRTDKYPFLSEYVVTVHPDARAAVSQWWCGVQITIQRAPPAEANADGAAVPAVTLDRSADIEIEIAGYDIFRVFASTPEWVALEVEAQIDGRWRTLGEPRRGFSNTGEIDMPLDGVRLDRLRLSFSLTRRQPAEILIEWLGLSNRARQDSRAPRPGALLPAVPGAYRRSGRRSGRDGEQLRPPGRGHDRGAGDAGHSGQRLPSRCEVPHGSGCRLLPPLRRPRMEAYLRRAP